MKRLEQRVAMVIGGGTGIGREIARGLAGAGATLALVSRDLSHVQEAAAELKELGGAVLPVVADVTRAEEVDRAVKEVLDAFGTIDILVNSAGYGGPTVPVLDITLEEWERVQAVNLRAVFLASKAVLPSMIEHRRGSIINISGTAGKTGFPLRGALSAAKWGVLGFTQTLALEVGPYNVRVNAIVPGAVLGDRLRHVFQERAEATGRTVEEVETYFRERAALRRFADPAEVAAVVVFLASDESVLITGEAINTSAGEVMI